MFAFGCGLMWYCTELTNLCRLMGVVVRCQNNNAYHNAFWWNLQNPISQLTFWDLQIIIFWLVVTRFSFETHFQKNGSKYFNSQNRWVFRQIFRKHKNNYAQWHSKMVHKGLPYENDKNTHGLCFLQ